MHYLDTAALVTALCRIRERDFLTTQGMARKLGHLPRREPREDRAGELLALGLEALDLLADVDLGIAAHEPELADLGLELGHGPFEIEESRLRAVEGAGNAHARVGSPWASE